MESQTAVPNEDKTANNLQDNFPKEKTFEVLVIFTEKINKITEKLNSGI